MTRLPVSCRAALVAASLVLLSPWATAGAPAGLDQLVAAEGLERVRAPAFDLAYVRPGVGLAGYGALLLDPIDAAFRAGWNPRRSGSSIPLNADEREQLRRSVMVLVTRSFGEELLRGPMRLVNEPGPGVLRIHARLVDLELTDPNALPPGRVRVLTTRSGEATLVVEISDASTGELLARIGDWEELRSTANVLRQSSPTRLAQDVEAVGGSWGRAVREFIAAGAAH